MKRGMLWFLALISLGAVMTSAGCSDSDNAFVSWITGAPPPVEDQDGDGAVQPLAPAQDQRQGEEEE